MLKFDLRDLGVLLLVAVVAGVTGCNSNLARNPDDPSEALFFAKHKQYPPSADIWDRVRDGMRLDIPNNDRVERFEKWYSSRPRTVARMQDNANLYLYHIVEKVAERGLPMELALLPAVESNYRPGATSRSGAAGLWQFIPSTGRVYGLEQNRWYDARRDLIASTDAALDYLTYLHEFFDGDWEKAIAAYNAGEGTIERAVRARGTKSTDYWSLRLPRETMEYVPRLLALASIVKAPGDYDVSLAKIPNKPPLTRVETNRSVDLALAAERCGLDKKEFCEINSAHKRAVTKSNKTTHVLVPTHKADTFQEILASLPTIERIKVVKTDPRAGKRSKSRNRTGLYVVKKGDTLSSIARAHGISVKQLRSQNSMDGSFIKAGQKLAVGGSSRPAGVKRVSTVKVKQTYKVKTGDTLWSIARSHKVSLDALCAHNGINKKSVLKPGQTLHIPELITASAKPRQESS